MSCKVINIGDTLTFNTFALISNSNNCFPPETTIIIIILCFLSSCYTGFIFYFSVQHREEN